MVAGCVLAPFACAQSGQGGGVSGSPAQDAAPTAHAVSAQPEEKSWRFGVALGYGRRTNPLIQSQEIPVVVDIDFAWFGERWFFDNFDLGFELFDHPRCTTNIVARLNSDLVCFGKTNTRYVNFSIGANGTQGAVATPPGTDSSVPLELKVPHRDFAVELGVETWLDGSWGQATLRAFHDASSTHDGYEISADYSYRWHRGRFVLAPSLGAAYKSARLNDYYWGVHADEVRPTLQGYRVDAGIGLQAGVRATYYLTKSVRLALSANYERLPDSVASSPIVARPYVAGYFGGLAWQF